MAALITKLKADELESSRAGEVFHVMLDGRMNVSAAMGSLGIEQVDEEDLLALCRELIAANPKIVTDLKEGKQKAVGALIGQAKKKNPNVNPSRVRQLCMQLARSEK